MTLSSETTTKPSPEVGPWTRNITAVLLGVTGMSFMSQGPIAGIPLAALGGVVVVVAAWFVSSPGKEWRTAKNIRLSGTLTSLGAIALIIIMQTKISGIEQTKLEAEFAKNGEAMLADVRASIQQGHISEAKTKFDRLDELEDPRIKPLGVAIEALESALGQPIEATRILQDKIEEGADVALNEAALADLNPMLAKAYAETKPQREKARRVQASAEAESAEVQSRLSGWDGSHRAVVEAVKAKMNDPDSFKHVATSAVKGNNGSILVHMTYRGRNGFGGVVTENVIGVVDANDNLIALTAAD